MTTTPTHRLEAFDPVELAAMQAALVSYATDILEDASREEIAQSDLPVAAASYLAAMRIVKEHADRMGEEHPFTDEGLELIAAVIAEGDAPMVAKAAREAAGS